MSAARFPIQARHGSADPRDIAWTDAAIAYTAYAALFPSSAAAQSLERLAERGGFGWVEYLALNDVAVWMRSNADALKAMDYVARHRKVHDVFNEALTARSVMHK